MLTEAKLTAVPAWTGAAKRYSGAVVAVDVAEVAGKPMALGNYLGETYDEVRGTIRELYGRRLSVSISLEVRAVTAEDCEKGCEAAADALLSGGLPSGLRFEEQTWEAVSWDQSNQMFLRKGCVKAQAYFIAKTDQETGILLDFTLKGVLST
jgi:hypothetical protein